MLRSSAKKRYLFAWTLLLSITIVCAQGVKLHVHNIDHDHEQNQQHTHMAAELDAGHSHLSIAHLSTDESHIDHHDKLLSELDVNPECLLIKVSSSVLALALFCIAIIVFFTAFIQQLFYLGRGNNILLPWRYVLSPPLRAPPL